MLITHKAHVSGYNPRVWLNQKAITNLIALNNLINKYHITYDRLDEVLILHQ